VTWGYPDKDYELIAVEEEVPAEDEDGRPLAHPDGSRSCGLSRRYPVLKGGATLKPDGVMYDRGAVMLLDVLRRQRDQIARLEARLAALEAKRG
jgi:hypothetical protein